MNTSSRRTIAFIATTLIVVALCIIFPRVLAFAELAARELRYLWWLVLIAGIGLYLAFFAGKNKP
jgi:hypothetical protein